MIGSDVVLKLRILEILEEQGKTKYWLCKRLEMTYTNFNNIVNNNTSSIKFATLERISILLEVPVGELFEQTPDESDM